MLPRIYIEGFMVKKKVVKERNYEVGKGKPPKEYHFKPGNCANPKGAVPSLAQRTLRKTTNETLAATIQKAIEQTPQQLQQLLKHPDISALEAIVIGTVVDAVTKRNYDRLEVLLARVLGKIPDRVDMTTNGESLNISKEDHAKIAIIVKDLEEKY